MLLSNFIRKLPVAGKLAMSGMSSDPNISLKRVQNTITATAAEIDHDRFISKLLHITIVPIRSTVVVNSCPGIVIQGIPTRTGKA
jgi:hypothetical protein